MKRIFGVIVLLTVVFILATLLTACSDMGAAPTKIVVTFDSNGGSVVPEITVKEDGKITLPANPTKEGYTFDGWYLDDEAITVFDSSATISASVTVYAKWTEKPKYTLTFFAGEGAYGPEPTMAAQYAGASITLPTNTYTKTNHTFSGWKNGDTVSQAGATYVMPARDLVFTATWVHHSESQPINIVASSIVQSSVIIYTTGSAISLAGENFVLPNNTTFANAICETDIIEAGNYTVSVVVNANSNYTINGMDSYRFDNVSIVVTQAVGEQPSFGAIINHEDAQKADLLALNAAEITSIKEDLRIAYFHTSHGNQIIEGNYAINYMFGNNRSKNFSDTIVFDSYGANMYVDAGQKDSAIGNVGTDIGSLVTATKSFFGDAGQSGDLLFEAGKNLDVNVVIWSWCGELSVFSEERVRQYLNDLTELENYYNGINNSKKIVFVYMTGHLYNDSYYTERTDDTKATNTRNNAIIRNYCINNNKILFDFEDIESYDPDGVYYGDVCNDTSLYWDGHVAEWWARNWQNGKTEDVDWVSLDTLRNSTPAQNFDGFKPITATGFSHVEYSIIVLSKAYAFWGLLSHLITVV